MSDIQNFLISAGYDTRSYSGRGMYGNEGLGFKFSDTGNLIADLLTAAIDMEDSDLLLDIAEEFRNMSEDNLGYDMIGYWKKIQFVGNDEDDEEWEDE